MTAAAWPGDEQVEAYLRTRGLIGPIDAKFIGEIRWTMIGAGVAQALQELGLYPAGADGMRAFMDELLSLDTVVAAFVPQDAPVRRIGQRAMEIVQERLAGAEVPA